MVTVCRASHAECWEVSVVVKCSLSLRRRLDLVLTDLRPTDRMCRMHMVMSMVMCCVALVASLSVAWWWTGGVVVGWVCCGMLVALLSVAKW